MSNADVKSSNGTGTGTGADESSSRTPEQPNHMLQEALGVTALGTCSRHPNCPVLVAPTSKIMSCRVCFSEEKSVGIRQTKSFAAVVQQVQRMSDAATNASGSADSSISMSSGGSVNVTSTVSPHAVANGTDSNTTTTTTTTTNHDNGNTNNASNDILSQPHAVESLMKRLSQVQNWMLRQKEKEVSSLQLQIQRLERMLNDKEQVIQEQSQTVRGLRRTIQQDLKIIKTMAMQKERLDSMVAHFNAVADKEDQEEEEELAAAADIASAASEQENDPLSLTGSPCKAPNTTLVPPVMSPMNDGEQASPPKRRSLARAKSEDLTDMAFAISRGGRRTSPRKTLLDTPSPSSKKKAAVTLNDRQQHGAAVLLVNPKGGRPGRRTIASDASSTMMRGRAESFRRRAPTAQRSVDGFDLTLPIAEGSDHMPAPYFGQAYFADNERSSYWNDDDVQSAHNPSKLFASFRGGLLDIPKSPPPARHDLKKKTKAKLNLDTSMMNMLRTPSMRSMDSTGEPNGPTAYFNEQNPAKKENPMCLLAAKLKTLPLSQAVSPDTSKGDASDSSHQQQLLSPPLLGESMHSKDSVDTGYSFADYNTTATEQSFTDDATAATGRTLAEDALENTSPYQQQPVTNAAGEDNFSVTNAACQDKYGDSGSYTGTVLAQEGLPSGNGCMTYESGRVYDGNWLAGQWNGKGKLLNPNGDTYEGDFILDARHGTGVYKWDNGDIYVGIFSQDKRHGNGKFSFHNGNVYEGEFCDGMFDGQGKYDFEDGSYEGDWKWGRYDGQGQLKYATGGMYTGDFKNSVAHGFGVEVTPDGVERRGVWDNGQPGELVERK